MYKIILLTALALLTESNGQFFTDGTVPQSSYISYPVSGGLPVIPAYAASQQSAFVPTYPVANSAATVASSAVNEINFRPSLPQAPNMVEPPFQEQTSPGEQLLAAVQWVAQSAGYPTAVAILSRLPILGQLLLLPVTWFLNLSNTINSIYKFPVKMLKALLFGY